MIAKTLGLPIKRFIASTNNNDTVPRYWASGDWDPKATVATMSNAMDVSRPNNWPRIEALFEFGYLDKEILSAAAIDEEYTQVAMKQLQTEGYVSEPHAAIAYKTLKRDLQEGEVGIFLELPIRQNSARQLKMCWDSQSACRNLLLIVPGKKDFRPKSLLLMKN